MKNGGRRDLTVVQNLKDANCDDIFIERFMEIQAEDAAARIRLLKKRRAELLCLIHENERYLEYIDYLVYQIEREKKAD